MPHRRVLLPLIVPMLGACVREAPPPPPRLTPIGYRHLTPLALNLGALEIAEADPPRLFGDLGATLPIRPAEAIRIMARDRLSAVGSEGVARFAATRAALLDDGRGGLTCQVACRLEVTVGDARLGLIEAEARAAATGPDLGRADAPERLLRRAMDDLNVEFEFQLRRTLRDWLVTAAPGTRNLPAPPREGVEREDLPRG